MILFKLSFLPSVDMRSFKVIIESYSYLYLLNFSTYLNKVAAFGHSPISSFSSIVSETAASAGRAARLRHPMTSKCAVPPTMDFPSINTRNPIADQISYINSSVARSIDDMLMTTPGFSLDTLMELAGYSVACAAHQYYLREIELHDQRKTQRNVLILCGPGNNGGDGLVAARHLKHFGFNVSVLFPKPKSFTNLVTQCRDLEIPILKNLPEQITLEAFLVQSEINLVIDAIFGFSFDGPVREPFQSIISTLATLRSSTTIKTLSVDVPSGWSVDLGDIYSTGFVPDAVVSLTVPKLCMRSFRGIHYVGGRFVPPKVASHFHLTLPDYGRGVDQFADITASSQQLDVTNTPPTGQGECESSIKVIYVTVSSASEASSIARQLVARKLVACVNLVPSITSIYEWQGVVEESSEVLMMMKTRSELVASVTKAVEELHSYDLPEVIVVDVKGGSQAYIDWVRASTTGTSLAIAPQAENTNT